jgi:adenosylcobyric acid synthase
MVLGTASSVGKSLLVTALCRAFRQRGVDVAPFKAQNMSNNAAVTADGLEIGRAQAEQAAAAGLEPTVEMNPVLLKPTGDRRSHVILDGRPAGVLGSADFTERKASLWPHVERALDALRSRHELVIAEGAGSPAEPNLQASDIVNLAVARHAGAVTLIVADIDRGGAFAHLLGTHELVPTADRRLIRGFVLNRFRGDPDLLQPAIADLERRTAIPTLGVVPWIEGVSLADEDAVALERRSPSSNVTGDLDIAVIQFPRIANFDDFDPLAAEVGVRVRYVNSRAELGMPDLIVLPGTRATVADLAWLRANQLDAAIEARAEAGARVLGICGGFQMLGSQLTDPTGVEAEVGTSVDGLGLLPLETVFGAEKTTRRVRGVAVGGPGPWELVRGAPVEGYEIHIGVSAGEVSPLLEIAGAPHGAVSADGSVAGAYIHGLFHNDAFRRGLLAGLGRASDEVADSPADGAADLREREFDRLAEVVRAHLDLERIEGWLWPDGRQASEGSSSSRPA